MCVCWQYDFVKGIIAASSICQFIPSSCVVVGLVFVYYIMQFSLLSKFQPVAVVVIVAFGAFRQVTQLPTSIAYRYCRLQLHVLIYVEAKLFIFISRLNLIKFAHLCKISYTCVAVVVVTHAPLRYICICSCICICIGAPMCPPRRLIKHSNNNCDKPGRRQPKFKALPAKV